MKKALRTTIILVLVVVFLVGCATPAAPAEEVVKEAAPAEEEAAPAEEEKEVTVGVQFQDFSNPAHVAMFACMEAKAEELGIKLVMTDAKADPLKQKESIENFVNAKYDGVILQAFDQEANSDILTQAREEGMFVIAFDTALEEANVYFGLDNVEMGRQIARNAAKWIKETFPADQTVEVGIGNYPLNQVCLDREAGMLEELPISAPNAVVVATGQSGYTPEGIEVGEVFAQAHPNMKVVIGIDDAGMLGVYESFVAAGMVGDDIGLFAIDAHPEAIRLISENEIYRSTINCDLCRVGEKMVQASYDIANDNEVEKVQYFECSEINIDNAKDFLK